MVQMLDNIELDGPMPVRRISISNTIPNNHHNHHHHPSSTRSNDASMKRASVRRRIIFCHNCLIAFNVLQFGRRASLDDLEQESCQLAPIVHHRIVILRNDEHLQQLLQKKIILETNRSVIAEDDES